MNDFPEDWVEDVAGVTRVCNNLQILFASIPPFSDFGFLREKMPNKFVAAGSPNVPDPSKSIGLQEYWSCFYSVGIKMIGKVEIFK